MGACGVDALSKQYDCTGAVSWAIACGHILVACLQQFLFPSPLCVRSHQMLLVNNKEAAAVAQAWMRALVSKGGGGGRAGGGGGGSGAGGPRSRL